MATTNVLPTVTSDLTNQIRRPFALLAIVSLFFISIDLTAKTKSALYSEDPSKVKTALTQVQEQIKKMEKTIYHSQHQEKVLM
jgi:hypothetical protein